LCATVDAYNCMINVWHVAGRCVFSLCLALYNYKYNKDFYTVQGGASLLWTERFNGRELTPVNLGFRLTHVAGLSTSDTNYHHTCYFLVIAL